MLSAAIAGLPAPREGKVRALFDLGDELLLVATDRISAFDVVMATPIPDKGRVLTSMSAFWFDLLADVAPHHVLSTDLEEIERRVGQRVPQLAGRAMLVRKAPTVPIECVVRGYLAGSLWKAYAAGERDICGERLPDGLSQSSPLAEPIFTPATKAESGHDVNISFARACELAGRGLMEQLRTCSLELYRRARDHATQAGIVLADTKFEFGLTSDGPIWIDEALTPDSSRYWNAASFAPGTSPESYDKQFVRDYLDSLGWDKSPPGPALPADVVQATRAKYLEAHRRITGHDLSL